MRRVDPNVYTEKYYLSDCTGFEEFKKSFGRVLEPRLERIVKEIPSVLGLRVLDIGCGRGELVFWSVRNGAREAVGIDYSKDAIKLAQSARKTFSKSIRCRTFFKVMDAKDLKFRDGSFDAVFLTEVLEHLYPEEQEKVFEEIYRVLRNDGFVFIHTAPNRWFNDFTYRFWCYPISSFLVGVNDFLTGKSYGNLLPPSKIRTPSHKIMHVNEPDYFSLKKLFNKSNFYGKLYSTNITVNKPIISWKDRLFNFLVYLSPLSESFPFNILWGNDFVAVLRKR